jgi:predicted lactoylglutathione lyase
MVAETSLEEIVETARAAGVEPATEIYDEMYGRCVRFEDPDGLRIIVDEHDPDLYG